MTGFETLTGLEYVNSQAFYHCYFPTLDLSGMTKLRTIGSEAFKAYNLSYKTVLTLPQGDAQALATISTGAFEGRKLDELTIENLPELTTIGDRAFYHSGMNALSLRELPKLNSIGDYAFADAKLTEVEFENLPQLKRVPYRAFIQNTGVATYDNRVVIWNEPRDQNVIPSTSTFIVNPETPVDDDYVADDFRYGLENGEWCILGFTDVGLNKLIAGRRNIVFPKTDPNGRTVTGFGKEAFAGMDFDKADLSLLAPDLKVVGDGAFEDSTVKSFDFKILPNLTKIGNRAFKGTHLTEADFSQNPELAEMGSYAFSESKIRRVQF